MIKVNSRYNFTIRRKFMQVRNHKTNVTSKMLMIWKHFHKFEMPEALFDQSSQLYALL